MMFMLGNFLVRDRPRQVLGLRAQVLTKSDIKTPGFVGVEREVVIES